MTKVIYEKVKEHKSLNELDDIKFKYGLEMLITNLLKAVVVFAIGAVTGVLLEIIIVLISYNTLRNYAYGIHAKSSKWCLITSIILFNIGTVIVKDVITPGFVILLSIIVLVPIYYLYSPADTKKRPIIGCETRKALKKQSLLVLGILLIAIILVPYQSVKTLLLYGILIETVMILPITYSVFKEDYNNYEKYENEICGSSGEKD